MEAYGSNDYLRKPNNDDMRSPKFRNNKIHDNDNFSNLNLLKEMSNEEEYLKNHQLHE